MEKYNYYEICGTSSFLRQRIGYKPVYIYKNKKWEKIDVNEWGQMRLSWMPSKKAKHLIKLSKGKNC